MEHSLTRGFPEKGSDRFNKFEEGRLSLYNLVREIIAKRREERIENENKLFLDYLLELDDSEERIFADGVTYIVGGFHTTGNMLTWALYYLARDEHIQERAVAEILSVLGEENVNETNIGKLKFMRQIQEETLRCSVLAPWGAKLQEEDVELGGYIVPENTPVITALGVMLKDETCWPDPERFDPERFSSENMRARPAHAFSPFGLAGKRICPGYRFAYSETAVVLVTLLRRFRLRLVEGQDVRCVHGLVTHVSDEVWLSVTKR